MKPTSERMMKVATERRIRTPAIWTILKDYAAEVKTLEALIDEQNKLLDVFRTKLDKLEQETIYQLKAENEKLELEANYMEITIGALRERLSQKETA